MEVRTLQRLKSFGVYLVILLVTLEISPFVLSPVLMNDSFRRQSVKDDLNRRIEQSLQVSDTALNNDEGYLSEHILHPYLGFVHKTGQPYNEFGFLSPGPILKRADSVVNICIMGGSVAKQLFQNSAETLKELLQDHPGYTGKKINVVSVALGGFKQPQQLLALNYLLSLGAQYDVVINLDGFNEVVLPLADNLPFGIYPSFPRHWNVYSRKSFSGQALELIGQQAVTRKDRYELAAGMKHSMLRFSNFGLFLWKIRDRASEAKAMELDQKLREVMISSEADPQSNGPGYQFSDTTEFLTEQVNYWASCSRQMHALSKESGFEYFHFLQPNQYVEGSKILTDKELETAFEGGDFIYRKAVEKGYPMLIKKGVRLSQDELNFIDLTPIFRNSRETVYSDKCCHLNKTGYNIVMKAIFDEIVGK